jgi:hypothetical protein
MKIATKNKYDYWVIQYYYPHSRRWITEIPWPFKVVSGQYPDSPWFESVKASRKGTGIRVRLKQVKEHNFKSSDWPLCSSKPKP